MRKIAMRVRSLFRREAVDAELEEELRAHLERAIAENVARGMTPEEARYAALREFGGVDQIREECSDMRKVKWLQDLLRDLRYGLRMLRKSPGFTAIAVLTLALGVGANTAVFSIVNSILFKPLPVNAPEQLVDVYNSEPGEIIQFIPLAYPDYTNYRDQNSRLSGLLGFAPAQVALEEHGEAELIPVEEVTGNYFEVLGLRLALGRGFDPAQDRVAGANPAAVLSYAMWQNKFGSDPKIIGTTLVLNEQPMMIVGVAPADFHGLMRGVAPGLWVPISMDSLLHLANPVEDRGSQWVFAIGRLKPGVTVAQAEAELKTIAAHLAQTYPNSNKDRSAVLLPASQVRIFPEADKALYATSIVLLGFVGMILLIACANIAGMLMARATGRRREIAIRTALGGGRFRLIRQLLTENLLLSIVGGIGALFITVFLNRTLSQALANLNTGLPVGFGLTLSIDGRVLGFTLAIVLATTLLFGLIPALKTSSGNLPPALKEDSGAATGSRQKNRLLNSLVVGQLTISLVLLICAGLSIRSLWNSSQVNPGFDPTNVATASFSPSLAGHSPSQADAFYQQLADRLRALPGVQSVSLADRLPLTFVVQLGSVAPEGKENDSRAKTTVVNATVGTDYFATMRIAILQGRPFQDEDNSKSTPVVIVNQTLAKQFWPGQNPIGKRVVFGGQAKYYEVAGVAADGKYITLGEASRPFVYRAMRQSDIKDRVMLARTAGDPRAALAAIRDISRRLDPKVPVTNRESLQQQISVSLLLPRASGVTFGFFGLLGLLLASIGLYGVVAYMVAQRTHEVGIRMTLGATPRDISRLVMGRGLRLISIGAILGLVGALAMTRVLSVVLYGVSARDPITFAAVALFLIVVALAACYIPARRAMCVDPIVALRHE